MLVKFTVSCLGYSVGGNYKEFSIEIDNDELFGLSEEEKQDYICKCISEYIYENLDYGYEIEGE